jgi:hypothetical protein
MLSLIEQRVTARIGDALAARSHLKIVTAPGPAVPIEAGQGRVIVALDSVTADAVFPRDELSVVQKEPPLVRRVLPLHFTLAVRLRLRPAADVDAARTLLLDDLALTMHALSAPERHDGSAFAPQANDGFDVLTFALDSGKVQPDLVDGNVAADLQYEGTAEIWPREPASSADEVKVIDRHVAAQKADITATPSRIRTEGTSRIVVRSIDPKRLVKNDGTTAPLKLAVRVVSDLPPEKRGRITNGVDAGAVRLIDVDAAKRQAVIDYVAPKAPLGVVGVEFVAIHFARSDNTAGALLGTAAIALVEVKGP